MVSFNEPTKNILWNFYFKERKKKRNVVKFEDGYINN